MRISRKPSPVPTMQSWRASAGTHILIEMWVRSMLVSMPSHINWCAAFLRDRVNVNVLCTRDKDEAHQ
jgi:hypothetical protein